MRYLVLLPAIMLLSACGESSQEIPTLAISQDDLTITLLADGELKAVSATPIAPGGGGRGGRRGGQRQTLAWIAPNHTVVKTGDVVARFDPSGFQREVADAEFELMKLSLNLTDKGRELDEALLELGNQGELVEIERDMADQFNIDNDLLYSRLEMIDNLRDEAFLDAKADHLDKKGDHYETKTEAERAVLSSQQQTQQVKLRRSQEGLDAIEVLAPHDGVLVYEKNWGGQEPRVGQQVFPGAKLATLPDLSKMKAVLYVPEAEATGLTKDLPVTVVLEAYTDRPVSGQITGVSHKAQPRERDNPVKYFTVDVLLDQSDPAWLRPGQRVSAMIEVAKAPGALAVPNQSIFQDDKQTWVYRKTTGGFERQLIEIGLRGPSRSQITSGVNEGDRIALVEPTAS